MATTKPAAKTAAKSTAVAVKKPTSANIVSIKDALKAQVAAMAGRTAPSTGNMIRATQDKKFLLPDGTKTDGPLKLVVVDFTSKNSFYESAFDQKNPTPPACFSIGDDIKSMVPSKNAPLSQAANCASCPNNQFGSDGDGKACKNSRVLAVLPPDADESTSLWLLATSPTATKGFDAFVASTARVFEMPPVGVVVEVGFDPSVTYAKMTFGEAEPNPNVGVHFARQAEARELLTAEPDVSKFVPLNKTKVKAGRR